MQNIRQDEAQARIKIIGSNINNFRYEDDTTLMEESEEDLKNLLMNVKEESGKVDLKLNKLSDLVHWENLGGAGGEGGGRGDRDGEHM